MAVLLCVPVALLNERSVGTCASISCPIILRLARRHLALQQLAHVLHAEYECRLERVHVDLGDIAVVLEQAARPVSEMALVNL